MSQQVNRNAASIAHARLANQSIAEPTTDDPVELVRRLGAVQAQDFAGAKWAVGLRLTNSSDRAIEDAFNRGDILRTHILRPTWHFVTPADIRWMLELSAPRIVAANRGAYRMLGLDEELFRRSNAVIQRALTGNKHLTRSELVTELNQAGIILGNLGYVHLLMRAELDGLICSGPRIGKKFTYALLDERAPWSEQLSPEDPLSELTLRYFTSHGPATIKDFAWWSGLKINDARRGIELVNDGLQQIAINGVDHFTSRLQPDAVANPASVHLLPNYDEYIVGYQDRSAYWHPAQATATISRSNPLFSHTIVVDGQIVGTWSRTNRAKSIDLSLNVFTNLDQRASAALDQAIERLGDFATLSVQLKERDLQPD